MRRSKLGWRLGGQKAPIVAGIALALISIGCSASGGGDSGSAGSGAGSGGGPAGDEGDGSAAGSSAERADGQSPVLVGDGSMPGVGGERPPDEQPLPLVEGGTDFTGFDVDTGEVDPGEGCQQAARVFTPQIPTVFMLVDRSNTMFTPGANGVAPWTALRGGALEVIEELQDEVRFGFGAFSGTNGGVCPLMPNQPPALGNHADIAELYNSLEMPVNSKETPTLLAMRAVADLLWADTTPGAKYILFVTDGEPDYCDDGAFICPADSVVGLLQQLSQGLDLVAGTQNEPIGTLVFGVETTTSNIAAEVLQAFADAGSGLPAAPLTAQLDDVYYNCTSRPGWLEEFALTGKPLEVGQTTPDYAALSGGGTVYRPDPNDQTALANEIRRALAGVKSCTFDLAGDGVEVDVDRPDLGSLAQVLLNGEPVPFDPVNGWRMVSETTVQLEGQACATWREPVETSLDFDFPCDVIVVR